MGETQALVVIQDAKRDTAWRGADVVGTMLDMVAWLERAGSRFVTVILDGDFARDRELSSFLREVYPKAVVVAAEA
jgi:hypothetical protein